MMLFHLWNLATLAFLIFTVLNNRRRITKLEMLNFYAGQEASERRDKNSPG